MRSPSLLVSLVTLLPVVLHAETRYLNAVSLRSGLTGTPEFTWVADFTRDGRNDVLAASATSIAVLPGIGNGEFGAPLSMAIANLKAEGAADFNNDGTPDLYLSRRQENGFAIMPGLGNGRFGAAAIVNSGAEDLLVPGRFDADQTLDMAVLTNTRPATIAVFPSDGAGGFGSPTTTSFTFLDASDAATGDFDADGRVDVALTGRFTSWILWNDGGSRFTATGFERGDWIAAGDFDADGASDAIVTLEDTRFSRVSFGTKGARSFGSANVLVPVGDARPRAGDFDGNGRTDVALFGGSTVSILPAAAGRTFNEPVLYLSGQSASASAAGDADGDGRMDIVFAGEAEKDAVWWYRGNGDGTLRAYRGTDARRALGSTFSDADLRGFELADVDGDGRFDVVIYDRYERRLSVLRSNGAGGFHPVVHTPTGEEPIHQVGFMPAGDLDGDGRADIILRLFDVTGTPPVNRVLHGRSDGSFGQGALLGSVDVYAIVDLNGDGRADLLEFDGDLHPGNGSGAFGEPVRTSLRPEGDVHFADVDDNGLTDMLSRWGNDLRTFLNEGQGAFSAARRTWSYEIAAIGDLTGDGLPDLVVDHFEKSVQRGRGDGTFEDLPQFVLIRSIGGKGKIADFDGDGHNDLAMSAQILFGNGDGSFREVAGYRGLPGLFPLQLMGIADADGNSTPDLIVRMGPIVAIIPAGAPVRGTKAAALSLESSRNPTVYGAGATLTARVTNETTATKPKGAVRFEVAGRNVALVEIDSEGKASAGAAFEIGTSTVRATYAGDEEFAAATATLQQQTTKAPSKMSVVTYRAHGLGFVEATEFESGETIHIEARATPDIHSAPPLDGVITIRRGSIVLGTLTGRSRLQVPTPSMLPAGTHQLTAEWPGNEHYLASSATITVTVKARPSAPRRRGVRH